MRAFISQETDAIFIDDEFANLTNYSRRRSRYTYQFSVRIDQIKAISLRATKLRLTVKHPDNSKRTSVFDSQSILSPEETVDRLLVDKPTSKDKIRAKRKSIILRRSIDITGKMNNEVARFIDRFSEEDALTLLPTRRTYEFKKVSELILERSETSYNNNVFIDDDTAGKIDPDEVKASLYAINQMGKDPASLIMSRAKIRSQDNAIMGTISSPESKETGKRAAVISDLRYNITKITNNQTLDTMDPDDLVPVIVKKPRQYFTIKKSVKIHRRHFRNSRKFQVIIELLDRDGAIVQRETQTINHSQLARDYYIPRYAPAIKYVGCELGENVIEIRQRDKKCDGVLVLRRSITDSATLVSSEYEIVGKFHLRKRGRRRAVGQEWKRIIDRTPNTNPVIYRVLPIRGRRVGTAFKSIVAPPCKLQSSNKTTKNKFSAMFLSSVEEGIGIDVSSFDKEADFISIYRRDLSGNQTKFKQLHTELKRDLGAYRKITSPTMTFIDTSVKDGRVYEYYAKLLYADGNCFRAIGSQFIEYHALDDEVSFQIEDITVNDSTSQPNFTMKIISKESTKNGKVNVTEVFKNYISRKGIKNLYSNSEQQEEMRDDGNQLIAFSIERQNLTTGEREQFNIFETSDSPLFDDYRMGRSSRVKPLEVGNEYRYTVTACSIHPSALLKNASLLKTDRRTKRKYRVSFAKSGSRFTAKKGLILPRRSKRRNTGKNTVFNAGKTGSIQIVTANLTNSMPEMRSADIEKLNSIENKIMWTVKGDPGKIDHFIVSIELRNCSIPILTSAAMPGKTKYEIIDRFTSSLRGPVEFKITPVYVDFKRGDAMNAGGIISSGIGAKRRRQRKDR
ncbi:hypothetical protein OAA09_00470 [bacterium]|nr:hypothetical protein [bacterium]